MSFPAIQFARHIAQFHIQFYGRTGRTPIYFTAVLSHPPITVYPLTLARFSSRTSLVFFILNPRGHVIMIPADMDEPRTFPFPRGTNRLITAKGRKRSAVPIAFTRFRYANQTFLYREPRINYSLDTYTGILYSIIGA